MKRNMKRYFRSINLKLDAKKPNHFAHYYPTKKSARVVRSIVEGQPESASLVVASFGSGKSLAAGTASLITDNDPKSRNLLKEIASRLSGVDKKLSEFALARSKSCVRGLPILLEGYEESLSDALLHGAKDKIKYLRTSGKSSENSLSALNAIVGCAIKQKIDRIAIVWDEFGHHLETLASSGKTEALLEVQKIAEWASRQEAPQVSLTLLLHQNLSQYAGNLSQVAKSSWRKIEGRFGSIQYIEDSDELLNLISTVVSELRPAGINLPSVKHYQDTATNAIKSGLFKSYSQKSSLHKVLRDSYPLLPATLHELPKMASRLSQNERTVFTFLRSCDFDKHVSLRDLYQYFSSSMQADSGVGGSYRKWLETESALSKVSTTEEMEILAAATILGLGVSGERKRVSKNALAFATTNPSGIKQKAPKRAINDLIGRKLLLYRKNSDDISIWHGTDIDIRSRLKEINDSLLGQIDIIDFLHKEHAAPNLRPIKHNIDNSIKRYFQGRFVLVSELTKLGTNHSALQLEPQDDGAVVFCLAESAKEVEKAITFAKKIKSENESRLIFVIPTSPLPVSDLVCEIVGLRNLQGDTELLAEDPFLLPEIQDMVDSAQGNLLKVLHRIVLPNSKNNIWFSKGTKLRIDNSYDLHQKLSELADETYPLTPVINNELIVRRRVSRQMINARKKLILGILERSSTDHLGFTENATTPDVTLYRTVLKRSGLFRITEAGNKWATPQQIRKDNEGLSIVWKEIEDFFAIPANGKSFADIIDKIASPPYGTRISLVPILLAAGMKAFGKTISIKRKGAYLTDILASQIEDICSSPADYSLDVLNQDKKLADYLVGLNELFGKEMETGEDLIRQLYDTILEWRSRLPDSALTTSRVNKDTQSLQKELRGEFDPVELSLVSLPGILNLGWQEKKTLRDAKILIDEIEGITGGYTSNAIQTIREQLTISPDSSGNTLDRVNEWANCFISDKALMSKIGHKTKAILTRSLEAPNGRFTEASFARAISAILLGKNFEQWDDTCVQLFGDKLRETVSVLEHTALMAAKPSPSLEPLLKSRVKYYEKAIKRLNKGKGSGKTKKSYPLASKLQ